MTLTDSEIEYIEGILKRKMNELEEGMLDVMFSEHCSYKSSRPILGIFPTEFLFLLFNFILFFSSFFFDTIISMLSDLNFLK